MIFIHPMEYPWLPTASLIFAVKGNRGGVVVNTAGIQLKMLYDIQSQPEEKAASPGGHQHIKSPTDSVVINRALLLRSHVYDLRTYGINPFTNTIKRGR